MKLKTTPEDFIVKEILHYTLDEQGTYGLYLLKKTLWNTEDCLQWLSKSFGIPRKHIGYCGNKDKHAVTEQYITIANGPREIRTPQGFSLEYIGRVKEQLRLGMHKRNLFVITVREYDGALPVLKPIKNFFGEQRFSQNNVEIGLALVRKEYQKACALLHIESDSNYINALRLVPRHTLLLYIHAVQSVLWNEIAETLPAVQDDVPIPGFAPEGNPAHLPAMDALLHKHQLTRMDFINRSFTELSLEGGKRALLQDVQDFLAEQIEPAVIRVSLSLGKGEYATETLRQLLSE